MSTCPDPPFWETTPLEAMSPAQWESLCDGCGKCCLIRLEDEDTGAIHTTDVACKLFDGSACRCSDYSNRQARVPDCVRLDPANVRELSWQPIGTGRRLFDWHPLITGDPDSVHAAGMSVKHATLPETAVKVRHLVRRIRVWPGEDAAEHAQDQLVCNSAHRP
jgi:uncharacterized protein